MAQISVRLAQERDAETLARYNELMALETEDKRLNPELVRRGVPHLIADPRYGFYLVFEEASGI